jgi:hypothetical protein
MANVLTNVQQERQEIQQQINAIVLLAKQFVVKAVWTQTLIIITVVPVVLQLRIMHVLEVKHVSPVPVNVLQVKYSKMGNVNQTHAKRREKKIFKLQNVHIRSHHHQV